MNLHDTLNAIRPYVLGWLPTVSARYSTNAGQSIPNNFYAGIDFEDFCYDTHMAVTIGVTWHFTAPVEGYYHVNATVVFESTNTWADGDIGELGVKINGVLTSILDRKDDYGSANSIMMQLSGSDCLFCAAGDTISVWIYQSSGAALALYNVGIYNYVSIHKI